MKFLIFFLVSLLSLCLAQQQKICDCYYDTDLKEPECVSSEKCFIERNHLFWVGAAICALFVIGIFIHLSCDERKLLKEAEAVFAEEQKKLDLYVIQ